MLRHLRELHADERGFTIIELLVAVAGLGAIAGLAALIAHVL